jgi:hypothetical protein
MTQPPTSDEEAVRRRQQADLPLPTVLRRWLFDRWATRDALEWEWVTQYSAATNQFSVTFFVERSPALFDISLLTEKPVHIDRLVYDRGGTLQFVQFGVQTYREGDFLRLLVTPVRRVPTSRVQLEFRESLPDAGGRINVRVAGKNQRDLILVTSAHRQASLGNLRAAIDCLHRYEAHGVGNPSVSYWLSDWYQQLGDFDTAEQYALQAVLGGNVEVCAERYRSVQLGPEGRSVREIRDLQNRARQWPLAAHHGVLVIERHQEFVLGLDNSHLKKSRHLIEVRRAAAARMLTELSFPFSATKESVLFTHMRIIHADDTIENVPPELFTIGDQESKNILITVEDEKAGHWILPDLEPGDVIEWSYHLLCRNREIDGSPQVFILTSLFDAYSPTFQARSKFIVPTEQPIQFSMRNGDIAERRSVVDGKAVVVFESERFVPARLTGFAFENSCLNPLIVCATEGGDWQTVARQVTQMNFPELESQDELPEPLAAMLAQGDEPAKALERAFYWVRDKLKYASTRAGMARIGQSDRARRIVEAGVGNCSDKSYLLSLVCRRLNLPYEIVAISTKNGVLIDDVPVDQFDHVYLRAQVNGKWLHLDGANAFSVFGSPPAWCQGMQALALNDAGTIITIPVDAPQVNTLEISEVLDVCRDGHMHGHFDLQASAHAGRLIDGRWKLLSLSLHDQQQAGQQALRLFLPSAIVLNYSRESDTSVSSRFHVSGQHSRGPLVPLGEKRVIATLSWEIPILAVSYWRTLQIERMFVVDFPMEIQLEVRFEGDLFRLLGDISHTRSFDSSVCSIQEDVLETSSATAVRRTIVFKKKLVHGDDVSLVPQSMEQIEKALQLVVSFDRAVLRT